MRYHDSWLEDIRLGPTRPPRKGIYCNNNSSIEIDHFRIRAVKDLLGGVVGDVVRSLL